MPLAAQQASIVCPADDRDYRVVAAYPVSTAAWFAGDCETGRAIDFDVVDHEPASVA
jgi:hypothetical protein